MYDVDFYYYKAMLMIPLLILLTAGMVKAQESLDVISGESSNNSWLQFSDAPNALYHHLAGQAYDLLDKRAGIISGLHTSSDWRQRQEHVRETLKDIIGPLPEKTPLNATITRTIDKNSYRVEHIVFESQPEFYVTGTLFIPKGLREKAPVIILCSGHQMTTYRGAGSQYRILNLVKKGFVVYAMDPVGQGERLEYYDQSSGDSVLGGTTREHSHAGVQAFITGSSQARYMTWDGIRAVDYLLTREEIDPERIGITGGSGGGTQSAYIAAMDDRIYAAAPGNYITNFSRLLQSIGPQDAEQNLPGGIRQGIDHADLLSVRAPKPALIYATTRDFFSIQGTRETLGEVSKIYAAYGKPDNIGMIVDDAGHSSTQKNREAVYAFFQKHLNNPGTPDEIDVEPLSDEEIQVTSTGQVSRSLGGETVFSLNRMEAVKRFEELRTARMDLSRHIPEAVESAKKLSGYQRPESVGTPVFTGRIQRDGYVIEKYFVEGEGDYVIPYLLMVPDTANNNALLYLHPLGKSAGAAESGEMEWFVQNGFMVLAPDLVGIGEMGSGVLRGDSYIDGISYNKWFASVLVGRSITGIRAGDVVRLIRLMERDFVPVEIYGVARQEMGPVLLHAAAFEPTISRVALIEPYTSYRSIVMNRFYAPHFIYGTVAGSLGAYDLPDLGASLAPRKLMITGATDGSDNPVDYEFLSEEFTVIEAVYQDRSATEQLTISRESGDRLYNLFNDWIK